MKILKKTGIVIVVLLVIWVVMAFFCKSTIHMERSTVINADAQTVFEQVNTFKNWKSWSYWDKLDTVTMHDAWEGPASGVGAKHSWDSPNDQVGKGYINITKSEPGKTVQFELHFGNMPTSEGGLLLNDTTGGVKATWYMDMHPPFFMRPMTLFMSMDKMLGEPFEKTLASLKDVSEKISATPKAPEMKIELTTLAPMKIVEVKDSASDKELGAKFGPMYKEIGDVMTKQGAKQAGPVAGIYYEHKINPDSSMWFVFSAAVQTDKPVKDNGRVHYRETAGGNAVKASYYGPYEGLAQAHKQIQDWIKANNKTINGPVWEFYVTDPMTQPDQNKWLTEIYYPVQ